LAVHQVLHFEQGGLLPRQDVEELLDRVMPVLASSNNVVQVPLLANTTHLIHALPDLTTTIPMTHTTNHHLSTLSPH